MRGEEKPSKEAYFTICSVRDIKTNTEPLLLARYVLDVWSK